MLFFSLVKITIVTKTKFIAIQLAVKRNKTEILFKQKNNKLIIVVLTTYLFIRFITFTYKFFNPK